MFRKALFWKSDFKNFDSISLFGDKLRVHWSKYRFGGTVDSSYEHRKNSGVFRKNKRA